MLTCPFKMILFIDSASVGYDVLDLSMINILDPKCLRRIVAMEYLPIGLQLVSRESMMGVCMRELENLLMSMITSSKRMEEVRVSW